MPPRRSVLVTGAGSGIGQASAVALAAAGVDLTLVGRRTDSLRTVADSLAGVEVAVVPADMGSADDPVRVVDEHVERFGGLDGFVAAAGAWEPTPLVDMTAADWDATLDVHLRGAVLGAGRAARHMTSAGRGRIVLVSSVNGYASEPNTSAYSAAKTAVVSVARSLAVELADSGVTANAVAPGWVDTPMTHDDLDGAAPEALRRLNPQGRFGRADEIAEVVRWLLLDAPEFLTGSTLVVDGGQLASAPLP